MTKKTSTEIRQILSQLGLNEKESILYLAALELGECSIKELSEKTNINRTTIYLYINPLKQKGFLSEIKKGNRTTFIAEDPRDITNIVDRQKNELKTQIGELDLVSEKLPEVMQGLLAMSGIDLKNKPYIRVYEGFEGVRRVYEDTLEGDSDIFAFENVAEMSNEVKEYILKDYVPRRVRKNIFAYVLTPINESNKVFRSNDKKSLRETRFFDTKKSPIEIEINIYGGKLAFFSYKKEEMFGAIIESKAITNSMKGIFDFCWEFSK